MHPAKNGGITLPLGDCYAFACRATDHQTLGNLADRIAPIFDLRDGIAFELFCEFSSGHIVLLASKITKQSVYKSRGYSQPNYACCPPFPKAAASGLKSPLV